MIHTPMFREPSEEPERGLTFPEAFEVEMDYIAASRGKRQVPVSEADDDHKHLKKDLVGLAFSGGGIRSATFNLGVLQALASKNLLRYIDYLSTVSGGGYIGSWLSSWAYHLSLDEPAKTNQIGEIEEKLKRTPEILGDIAEPHEVRHLRRYSNYLTPRLGVLSGDTLAFIGTYLRNLALNQLVLLTAILAFLLLPAFITLLLAFEKSMMLGFIAAVLAYGFLLMAAAGTIRNSGPDDLPAKKVIKWVALPEFLFSCCSAITVWRLSRSDGPLYEPQTIDVLVSIVTAYVALWVAACLWQLWRHRTGERGGGWYRLWAPAIWAAPTGLAAGAALFFAKYMLAAENPRALVTYGFPFATLLILLVGCLHLGLVGSAYEDERREWWARSGGVIFAISVGWFLLCLVVLYVPGWSRTLWNCALGRADCPGIAGTWESISKVLSFLGITGAVSGWLATMLKGLFDATGSKTGPRGGGSSIANLFAKLALPVFVLGLLVAFACFLTWIAGRLLPTIYAALSGENWEQLSPRDWTGLLTIAGMMLVFYGISRFLGWRIDINELSLHSAYRNRLVRCYLGATNHARKPQPFTGFDEDDNIYLHQLKDLAIPYHILNTTVNVAKGRELELQSRKGMSFTFTPVYSGFDLLSRVPAYRLTNTCSWRSPLYRGVRLGTAMAISGAAASPNMGYYTKPSVSFLLTVFSVRLGWWLGNPRFKAAWESGRPRSSWRALMNELTGTTDDEQREVYLSDGGHFENLAIYELVRRRCRLIIACDAGCDPDCACNDLASAIEKCRVDFHTEITFEHFDEVRTSSFLFDGDKRFRVSKAPFTAGSIRYPDGSRGTLIYLKPSLRANLPQDVLAYARREQDFPHHSTGDQFFDEAQFESYRALGFACANEALDKIMEELPIHEEDLSSGDGDKRFRRFEIPSHASVGA